MAGEPKVFSIPAGAPFLDVLADAFLAGPEAVEVTATRWTTPEMLAIEADAIDRAIAGPPTAAVSRELVDAAIAARPRRRTRSPSARRSHP